MANSTNTVLVVVVVVFEISLLTSSSNFQSELFGGSSISVSCFNNKQISIHIVYVILVILNIYRLFFVNCHKYYCCCYCH